MNRQQKRRAWMVVFLVAGIGTAVSLVLYGLRQNINLFYNPSQIAQHEAPTNKTFRLGGMVKKGSLHRDTKSLDVEFILTDFQHDVLVKYRGVLPDLFREGQGIVANGQVNTSGEFIAEDVLAKHDSNYMPPEVKAALKKRMST